MNKSKQSKKPIFNREEKDFIHDLQTRNDALQQEQKRLQGKLKAASLTVKKLKQQIQTLKRRSNHKNGGYGARSNLGNSHGGASDGSIQRSSRFSTRGSHTGVSTGCRTSIDDDVTHSYDDVDAEHVLGELQRRLIDADDEIRRLKDENRRLVSDATSSQAKVGNVNEDGRRICTASTFEPSRDGRIDLSTSRRGHGDMHMLQHGSIMTKRTSPLETGETTSELLEQLQETQSSLKVLEMQYCSLEATSRVQLEVHKQTREKLEECNAYIRKQKDVIQELKHENQVTKQTSVSVEKHKEQMQELMEENRILEEKLSNLCDLPFLHDEPDEKNDRLDYINELENEMDHCKRQIEVLAKDNLAFEANTVSLEEEKKSLEVACSDLQDQIRQLQDEIDHGIENRQAVLRNSSTQTFVEFSITLPKARAGIDSTAISSENGCKELKYVTSDTNKANQSDIQNKEDPGRLLQDIVRSEVKVKMRWDLVKKIRSLHDQRYEEAIPKLTSFGSHENTLLLRITSCEMYAAEITDDSQTMLLIDLLNFESQASEIGQGRTPSYHFQCLYKLKIDEFTIEELIRRGVQIEVYSILGSSYQVLGQSMFDLVYLLTSKTGECQRTINVKSVHLNKIIGHICISASLRSSLHFTEEAIKDKMSTTSQTRSQPNPLNECEVRIGRVSKFDLTHRPSDDAGTSIYIQYHCLGFGDFVTTTIPIGDSLVKGFEHVKMFSIQTTPELMKILDNCSIELRLYQCRPGREEVGILLGKGSFSLENNQQMFKQVEIVASNGSIMGAVDLRMTWKHSLSVWNKSEEKGLDDIIRYFSNDGNVNYTSFLRYIDPPLQIYESILILQRHKEIILEAFRSFGKDGIVAEENFLKIIKNLGEEELCGSTLVELFRHIEGTAGVKTNADCIRFFLFSKPLEILRRKVFVRRYNQDRKGNPGERNQTDHIRCKFQEVDLLRRGFVSERDFFNVIDAIDAV